MKYDDYTVEDFILDDDFRRWILSPDQASRVFWLTWIRDHPQKVSLVEEARNIILSTEYDEVDVDEEKNIALWEKLKSKLDSQEHSSHALSHSEGSGSFGSSKSIIYRIAAVFAGLFIVASIYFYAGSSSLKYVSQFGEVKTIWLPDSSQVILNANSTLSVHRTLFSANTREVSLNGEAFFVVRKNPHGARKKFVVHANDIDVEVLGTSFNVNNRSGRTWVVLNTGKVQLNDSQLSMAPLVMNPGELGEYSEKAGAFTARKVDPERYTSWRLNQLIFDGNPLREIITLLKQNHGLNIKVLDSTLFSRNFKGKFPADRPDILLSAICASFDLKATRTGDTIVIDHKDGGR